MSSLQYGQISKILSKRREASRKREEFSQKIEEMGGINSGGSKIIVWDPLKGRPKKKHNAMELFQKETSYYKYHKTSIQRHRTGLR